MVHCCIKRMKKKTTLTSKYVDLMADMMMVNQGHSVWKGGTTGTQKLRVIGEMDIVQMLDILKKSEKTKATNVAANLSFYATGADLKFN